MIHKSVCPQKRTGQSRFLFFVFRTGCVVANIQHAGNDLRGGYRATPYKCAQDCDANAACKGTTWDTRKLCWQHSRIDNHRLRRNDLFEFYIKDCPYKGEKLLVSRKLNARVCTVHHSANRLSAVCTLCVGEDSVLRALEFAQSKQFKKADCHYRMRALDAHLSHDK